MLAIVTRKTNGYEKEDMLAIAHCSSKGLLMAFKRLEMAHKHGGEPTKRSLFHGLLLA
jgi:hypothetical protein